MAVMDAVLKAIFGSKAQHDEKALKPIIEQIASFENAIKSLSDSELSAKTTEFKSRISDTLGCHPKELDLTKDDDKNKLNDILNKIMPEAFAVVREASIRTTGMRHFDSQMMGGTVLHQGRIAEMKTGEGKTLVATLAVYLNAITELGVHVITVNDYLAKRDAKWMTPIYSMLDVSIGILDETKPHSRERKDVYSHDIVYGTNNEFGFDYLRDNMVINQKDKVQRAFYYAIVDEVDSILIDEARTPLIISGPTERNVAMYYSIDKIIPMLKPAEVDEKQKELAGTGDYVLDEKNKNVYLTEEGVVKVEGLLNIENLYASASADVIHHVNQALKAHKIFKRDVDYMITDGEVLIVDEFTGRTLEGRRYSDGLHQAIEAKEKVAIQNESQTYATITFQNFFRMYPKLAGMTGTAVTEEEEFYKIYKLDVAVIPPNKAVERIDMADKIFRTRKGKYNALATYVKELQEAGKPVLVGTVSVEMNEELSKIFKKAKIEHEILNAKNHSREAQIVGSAGEPGAVTLATNMAGRGTDIVLGGNPIEKSLTEIEHILVVMRDKLFKERDPAKKEELKIRVTNLDLHKEAFVRLVISGKVDEAKEMATSISADELIDKISTIENIAAKCSVDKERVLANGGLHVIGSERHESRRIDNQLRGRSGRQGDAGLSVFYLSLEDDLLRLFGGERVGKMMLAMGMTEEEEIAHSWLNKSIEGAQRKVEGRNFDVRKHLLEYDDVMNKQRLSVYSERNHIINSETIEERVRELISDVSLQNVTNIIPQKSSGKADTTDIIKWLNEYFVEINESELDSAAAQGFESVVAYAEKTLLTCYENKFKTYDSEAFHFAEKSIFLSIMDTKWKEHLYVMDSLREGIGLRGYAEKNPLTEYKLEGYKIFEEMITSMHEDVVKMILRAHIKLNIAAPKENEESTFAGATENKQDTSMFATPNNASNMANANSIAQSKKNVKMDNKVGRNDACPCGSGKKYKKCHGKNEE